MCKMKPLVVEMPQNMKERFIKLAKKRGFSSASEWIRFYVRKEVERDEESGNNQGSSPTPA